MFASRSDAGFTDEDLYRQTDLQVGAVGWLAQQALFADAAQQHHGFRSLNSETLIARPGECLEALAAVFEVPLAAATIASGPAFSTHSKDRRDYSAEQRKEEHARGKDVHAREIGVVVQWAEQLADHAGIPMTLPAPLLD